MRLSGFGNGTDIECRGLFYFAFNSLIEPRLKCGYRIFWHFGGYNAAFYVVFADIGNVFFHF